MKLLANTFVGQELNFPALRINRNADNNNNNSNNTYKINKLLLLIVVVFY